MPELNIDGVGQFQVVSGTRLVLALDENGGDVLYRCGGYAKCTTCRIKYLAGEPEQFTVAEQDKLAKQGNIGKFRLSCQTLIDHNIHVRILRTFSESDLPDPGPRPEEDITPDPEWVIPSKG